MAKGAGTASVVHISEQGGTQFAFDLTPYITTFTPDMPVDELDVTTIGGVTGEREYLTGFKSSTIAMEGIYDPTADNVLFAWRGGTALWSAAGRGAAQHPHHR